MQDPLRTWCSFRFVWFSHVRRGWGGGGEEGRNRGVGHSFILFFERLKIGFLVNKKDVESEKKAHNGLVGSMERLHFNLPWVMWTVESSYCFLFFYFFFLEKKKTFWANSSDRRTSCTGKMVKNWIFWTRRPFISSWGQGSQKWNSYTYNWLESCNSWNRRICLTNPLWF